MIPTSRARCSSNSRIASARAADCHASIGFDAGWFCTSRAMASREIATPLTLTAIGLGSVLSV